MIEKYENNRARTLTRFLKRINKGEDPMLLRKEANKLLTNIGPKDIVTAEQNLVDDGYSIQIVQLLSATFMLMGIIEDKRKDPRASLQANHILRTVFVEHDLIRCFIADLNDVAETIQEMELLTDISSEFRKLAHVTEHINIIKGHIEREDDIIFPYLKKFGKISLCQVAQGDHIAINTVIDDLTRLILSFNQISFKEFKLGLTTITDHLSSIVLEHISQEDILLYPIALGMITNEKIWSQMKALCDDIGYCCLHLKG